MVVPCMTDQQSKNALLSRMLCDNLATCSRLYRKIDEIKSSADVDEVQISSLSTYIEQLKAKREQLSDLDSKITLQIANEEELEEAILETKFYGRHADPYSPCGKISRVTVNTVTPLLSALNNRTTSRW